MMMSKPVVEAKSKAPAISQPQSLARSPVDAVADLERRLAQLAGTGVGTANKVEENASPPAFAMPPPAATTAEEPPVKGGKNALLARILAAQERAKQVQGGVQSPPTISEQRQPTPPPSIDLLSDFNPIVSTAPPPPAFDAAILPPPLDTPMLKTDSPPPAFDDNLLPPTFQSEPPPIMVWDPHAPAPPMTYSAPSAPDYHDLLAHEAPVPVDPPSFAAADTTAADVEAILGIEGLTDAERKALLEEQAKILASIQKEATSNRASAANSAADAFEQRSMAANLRAIGGGSSTLVGLGNGQRAIVHGPEKSQQAIADGTALQVQCLACQHWMQVTRDATLMNCPVCSTVQPVIQDDLAQMQADQELAEQLQKEEYDRAERSERQRARGTATTTGSTAAAAEEPKAVGWMEWLGLASSATTASTTTSSPERPTSFAQGPVERGQVGVSRPPGSGTKTSHPNVGELPSSRSRSFDSQEYTLPTRNTARVAEQQPLFSCVADSISTALTTAMVGAPPDGVDSTSLLAVPTIRRPGNDGDAEDEEHNRARDPYY